MASKIQIRVDNLGLTTKIFKDLKALKVLIVQTLKILLSLGT